MKVHVFPFSRRDGTPAADFPSQIPAGVIKDRVQVLSQLERELAVDFYHSKIASEATQSVFVEQISTEHPSMVQGTDQWYIPVEVPGTQQDIGQFVPCIAREAHRDGVISCRTEPTVRERSSLTEKAAHA
jgi:threonylcarbamoyladenosine tRNA methylthiotransferase MtaB